MRNAAGAGRTRIVSPMTGYVSRRAVQRRANRTHHAFDGRGATQ